MSANTTASQHNGMDFPKDNDTADKKIQVNTTPPLPVRKHQSITGNTKTLHRFGQFPREIQIKIFKLALPDPRIVHLGLEVIFSKPEDGITWFHARVNKTRAPGLLSLLETCITSNASVYSGDGFTKIQIQLLNSHPHTANKQHLSPNENFCYKDWGDMVLNDTYKRFSEDILMVNYSRFDLLYRLGESLDLKRLTHIAVSWFGYLSVSTPWTSGKITKLLNDTYSQCPCLKRLSVLGSRICDEKAPPVTRLLNIDKDLLKLDLEDTDGRQVPSEEADDRYQVLKKILKARYLFDRHFESYRKKTEEGNKNAIEYWNKVEVVNVFQCWPDGTQYDSTLYIPEIDSIVRSNDDGFLATLPESTPDKVIKLRDTLRLVELGDGQ
ncbi:uncharacterized protein EAE97_004438 [Botrytis byssoidea]|uniref:2EXR domain-containing protein n=1 Tax=Botrytis byssoidea TaxID=139641 RepID=A0A9P5IRA1_9HELO|nr:uncharacterized protein EAE97_004438 [Botrytis byssoidea]KAF7947189.1 hypothetical protein EAE97_004438 [Botrytis byssoidea]